MSFFQKKHRDVFFPHLFQGDYITACSVIIIEITKVFGDSPKTVNISNVQDSPEEADRYRK